MGKKKLFNDPVYGLIDFKEEIIYDLIDEPHFQRLRRIKQMGLSDYVYPGATHPRFQHAIGATHLLDRSMDTLISKNIEITEEERLAAGIAILYHDIGHGPFSHALEGSLIKMHHEDITRMFIRDLAPRYGKVIEMAMDIFEGRYPKNFLHSLISSHLDMDRMDYLSRDSYYTGVAEGVIGYDRIIKMLNVCDQQLVVEEKGLHSIEKFLISRYLMYAQVYLHKTSLVAEKMLKSAVERAVLIIKSGEKVEMTPQLFGVLSSDLQNDTARILTSFSALDDMDVWDMLKRNLDHPDKVLSMLCRGLIYRNLFEIRMSHEPVAEEVMEQLLGETANLVSISHEDAAFLVFQGKESVSGYKEDQSAIRMMTKSGMVIPLSEYTGLADALTIEKTWYYTIGPKK